MRRELHREDNPHPDNLLLKEALLLVLSVMRFLHD